MKKRILISSILVLFGMSLFGQTMNQYKKAAKKAFKNQEYGEALNFLNEIQKIDSAKFDLHYLQAEAARYYNAFELAERNYKQVLNLENANKFPLAILGLATVQKMQGKYDEAIGGFQQYIKDNPDTTKVHYKDAKKQIQACEWAKELIKYEDEDLVIKQLGIEVNTDFSDFAPTLYQNSLLFSSLRFKSENKRGNEKKYAKILQLKDGETTTFDLGTTSEDLHTAHIAFNQAQDKMYFNICQYEAGNIIQCKIYTRDKISDTIWSSPKVLPEFINQKESTTTQPNIGFDENTGQEVLFFISNRLGGKGGMDIWYSYLDANNQFASPINLKEANTEKDEFSPFFHNHTQTLFFSSNGRKSLGGHDIYKTILKDQKWQMIDHTGFPLNSSYNDVYFSLNKIGSEGYFASNREGTRFLEKEISACCYDIFKAEFNSYILDLKVLSFLRDNGLEEALPGVKITVYEIFEGAEKAIPQKIEPEGNAYFYRIKSNKKYRIVAEKDNFFPTTLEFNTERLEKDQAEVVKKVYLQPLKLNILTFTDEPPKAPLSDVKVQLIEIDEAGNRKKVRPIRDAQGNNHLYPLLSNRKYQIVANKDGYDQVINNFNTFTWNSPTNILTKELILPREEETIILRTLKPFPLYFDNDAPSPSSTDTTTIFTFSETLFAYKNRKSQFIKGYTNGLNGPTKDTATKEMEHFFDEVIDSNYLRFIVFTNEILKRLDLGRGVTISVQAYASPLASEQYNLKLTKRRISSMLNFYSTYKNGAMKKYVDNGTLNIRLIPHGESKAPEGISDNPNDPRNSIYSLNASLQRKVEIIEVRSNKNQNTTANSGN